MQEHNPEPREYRPVGPMSGHEVTEYYLDGLSRDHLESMLRWLSGYTPEGFEDALRHIGRIATGPAAPAPGLDGCEAPHAVAGYLCTLARGHDGDHEAWQDGVQLATWPQEVSS